MSVAGTLRRTASPSKSSTYLRQLIMNGVLPGPTKAREVTRGKTSPVAMPRSLTVPTCSPSESTTGRPSIWDR